MYFKYVYDTLRYASYSISLINASFIGYRFFIGILNFNIIYDHE